MTSATATAPLPALPQVPPDVPGCRLPPTPGYVGTVPTTEGPGHPDWVRASKSHPGSPPPRRVQALLHMERDGRCPLPPPQNDTQNGVPALPGGAGGSPSGGLQPSTAGVSWEGLDGSGVGGTLGVPPSCRHPQHCNAACDGHVHWGGAGVCFTFCVHSTWFYFLSIMKMCMGRITYLVFRDKFASLHISLRHTSPGIVVAFWCYYILRSLGVRDFSTCSFSE